MTRMPTRTPPEGDSLEWLSVHPAGAGGGGWRERGLGLSVRLLMVVIVDVLHI